MALRWTYCHFMKSVHQHLDQSKWFKLTMISKWSELTVNLVHFTNNTTPHPFITSIEPIDSKKCEERKKDSPLAQTICQASFRPIFLIAGQPEPPHPFNTLIELVFQGPVQSSLFLARPELDWSKVSKIVKKPDQTPKNRLKPRPVFTQSFTSNWSIKFKFYSFFSFFLSFWSWESVNIWGHSNKNCKKKKKKNIEKCICFCDFYNFYHSDLKS